MSVSTLYFHTIALAGRFNDRDQTYDDWHTFVESLAVQRKEILQSIFLYSCVLPEQIKRSSIIYSINALRLNLASENSVVWKRFRCITVVMEMMTPSVVVRTETQWRTLGEVYAVLCANCVHTVASNSLESNGTTKMCLFTACVKWYCIRVCVRQVKQFRVAKLC